jgi:hypothetical protein
VSGDPAINPISKIPTDQEIRDKGFKYIPEQKYLLNPFQLPTTDDDDDGGGGGGIPFTNAGDGFNPYNTDMSKINTTYRPNYDFRQFSEYGANPSTMDIKQMDMNQNYFNKPAPSGIQQAMLTAAGFIPGVGTAIKGFGMAKDFLGRVMPINERAIMENEARGAGIFTDDIGRIVTDDYNTAGGIMAGYNLNKIDADSFQKRRDTINKKMSDRINPETGKTFKQERLDLLDKSEEDILGARKKTKQIYKMRADKKAKDDTTGTDNGGNSTVYANENDPSDVSTSGLTYNQGGGQEGSYDFAEQNFSGPGNTTNAAGTEGEDQDRFMANGGRAGYFYGGRVNFKYGGLASIL